jgi:hypothetical protein
MLLCRISCELAGCVHQPIVGSGQTNLSHLYFSRLSLAMPAKLNFFKTPTSVRLVQVGPCPLPLEYQAATSHTGRQPCRVKSLYMKRFWGEQHWTSSSAGVSWVAHSFWAVLNKYSPAIYTENSKLYSKMRSLRSPQSRHQNNSTLYAKVVPLQSAIFIQNIFKMVPLQYRLYSHAIYTKNNKLYSKMKPP